MSKAKKIISVLLAVAMLMTAAPVSTIASAYAPYWKNQDPTLYNSYYYVDTTATTDVIRVANATQPFTLGTTIQKATPSGIPQAYGSFNEQAYAGETPAWPQIKATFYYRKPASVEKPVPEGISGSPTISATAEPVVDSVTGSDGNQILTYTYTWELQGGTAEAGTDVVYTIEYVMDNETKKAYAYAHVENVLIASGYVHVHYHRTDNWIFGTTKHARHSYVVQFIGKNVYQNGFRPNGNASLHRGFINWNADETSVKGGSLAGCGSEDNFYTTAEGFGLDWEDVDLGAGEQIPTMVKYYKADNSNNAHALYGDDQNRPWAKAYVDERNETLESLNIRETITVAETDSFNSGGLLSGYGVRFYSDGNTSGSQWDSAGAASLSDFYVADYGILANNMQGGLACAHGSQAVIKFAGAPKYSTYGDSVLRAFANFHYTTGPDGYNQDQAGMSVTFYLYNTTELYNLYMNILQNSGATGTYQGVSVTFNKGPNPQENMYSAASWSTFLEKFHIAGYLLQKPNTSQTELNSATAALANAYNGLDPNFHTGYTVNVYHYQTDTTIEVAETQHWEGVGYLTKATLYPAILKNPDTGVATHTATEASKDVTVKGSEQVINYIFYYDPVSFSVQAVTNTVNEDGDPISPIVNFEYDSTVTTSEFNQYLGTKEYYTFEGNINSSVTGWYYDSGFTQEVPATFTMPNESFLIYAKWETTPLHIYLDTQIEGQELIDLGSVQPNDDPNVATQFLKPATDPSVEGYLFVNYYADADFTTPVEWPQYFYLGETDRTIYGRFEDVNGKIIFESNGGSKVENMSFVANETTITAPADPTREGYTFAGWYYDIDCTAGNEVVWDRKMPDNTGFIAYAKWTAERHKINFNLNNPTMTEFDTQSISSISGLSDSAILEMDIPNEPRRFGYVFSHWVCNGQPYSFKKYPTTDITLYAIWRPVNTSAFIGLKAYEKLSGSYGDPISVAQVGDIVTVQMTSLANFYTGSSLFVFMYDSNFFELIGNGATAFKLNGENEYVSGIDASFTAVTNSDLLRWPDSYSDDFKSRYSAMQIAIDPQITETNYTTAPMNDGKWLVEFQLKVKEDATGSGKIFMEDAWTRNESNIMGTMFYGWSETESPVYLTTNNKVTPDLTNAVVEITLDETPTVQTTVNLNANPEGVTVNPGKFEATNLSTATFTGPAETEIMDDPDTTADESYVPPVRTGYTLTGWENADSTVAAEYLNWAEGYYAPEGANGNTYNAIWTPISYTINFYSDQVDGSIVANGSVATDYDAQIVPPADPTKTGYVFDKWVDADGNIVTDFPVCTGNADYYATWTPAEDTAYNVVVHYDFAGEETYSIEYTGTTDSTVMIVKEVPANPVDGVTYITISEIMETFAYELDEPNYVFDESDARNALPMEATILPDGSLEFQIYVIGVPMTATFDANGGELTITNDDGTTSTVTSVDVTGRYYELIVAPSENPTRYGYTFDKWTGYRVTYRYTEDGEVFKAAWTPISTNIQFMNYDGSEQIGDLVATDFGKVPKAPDAPAREGYDFKGWRTSLDSTDYYSTLPAVDTLNDESTQIAITYYAYYELTDYEVIYKVDGAVKYTYTHNMGDIVTIREDETKTGYTFSGWKINGTAAADFTMGTEPVTIEGTFTADTIGVKFNANGGKFSDDSTEKTVNSVFDQSINLPDETPTKAGYDFNGWATDASATEGEKDDLGTLTATSATYYATWLAQTKEYYVDIYVMDENGVEPTSPTETITGLTGTVDQPVDEYVPAEKTGFTVATDSVLTGTVPATGDLRLVVKYQRNKHTLYTDIDGKVTEAGEFYYEQTIVLPGNPEKTGYTFNGWTWSPAESTTMPNEDVTLTATWKPIAYTVAFDTDGGSSIASYTQDFGTVIAEPTSPTKTGYTFDYWVVGNSTEKVVFSDTTPTVPVGGITFKAIYKTNNYNIVYMNGAQTIETISVPFGTTKADIQASYAPAESKEPTADGKIFKDWNWASLAETMPANEVRIQAVWENKTYKITFNEMGGSPVSDIEEEFGKTIVMSDVTELEGHQFEYWYYENETEKFEIPNTMPALDALYNGAMEIELKAKWSVKEYTITFDENGGEEVADITANYGVDITLPTPTKTGYNFDYWYYDDALTEYKIGTTMPALDLVETDGSIKLTARWSVKSVTITFDANGGDEIAPITQDYNTYINNKPVPTRKGYTFKEWHLGAEDGPVYTIPNLMPADDIKLVAIWTINEYTINFADTGDSTVDSIVADFGEKIVAPKDPVKEGYDFVYWYYDNSDVQYVIGDTMPALDAELGITSKEITLTAKWSINQYTIAIDTAGGSKVNSITQNFDTVITKPANPTREGYTFDNWYVVAEDGTSTEVYSFPAKMPAENVSIIAKWIPINYTITFDEAGGTEVADITAGYETAITKPADPTREGYTFAYWYEAATPNTAFVFDTMPLNGAKLTAKWEIVQYTITIDADGGTYEDAAIENITLDYDAEIINPPAKPVKPGYDFDNWYIVAEDGTATEVYTFPAKMPAKNVSIVAKWNIVAYDVIFYNYDGSVYFNYKDTKLDYMTPINAAPAGEPVRTHYIFIGWSETENPDPETETAIDFATAGITVPVNGLKFYPIFERVIVTLELVTDSTAKVTNKGAVAPTTGYIYGIAAKTNEEALTTQYLGVKGDGRLEIKPTKYNLCGTGTKVEVWDNVTNEIVEIYYIVIFGDVNGDSGIDTIDVSMLLNEVAGNTKWSMETYLGEANADYAYYRVLAADLNGDGTVTNNDYTCLKSATLYAAEIKQEVASTDTTKMVYYS